MAHVLVVDDEKQVLELLTFLLEKNGHTVTTASDGQECLDKVSVRKPDLIILDVMLPVMDGYTVFTRLAANDETRHIPVLVLTAKGQVQDVFQMASNVEGCLAKPFEPAALQSHVEKILSKKSP